MKDTELATYFNPLPGGAKRAAESPAAAGNAQVLLQRSVAVYLSLDGANLGNGASAPPTAGDYRQCGAPPAVGHRAAG